MGKVLKAREVGDPVLSKISEEVDINNINEEVLDLNGHDTKIKVEKAN